MYNRVTKIPTIVGLFILLIGLGSLIFLIESRTNSNLKAETTNNPQLVKLTNLTESSFTVIWFTKDKVTGSLSYGTSRNSMSQIAFDERDIDNNPKQYISHYVTIRGLEPKTTYYFSILSGGKKFIETDKPYSIQTAEKENISLNIEPAYGQVLNQQNQPAAGSIVVLNMPKSLPLSSLVKDSGNWIIPLNIARDENLKVYKAEAPLIESIVVYSSIDEKAQAVTNTNNDSPVPPITIGKTYDFKDLESKKQQEQNIAQVQPSKSVLGEKAEKKFKVDIFTPEEGATFVSNKPLFRGSGIPNKEVTVEILSTEKITGKTTVNKDGTWSWTPPQNISPDKHIIRITTTNENGKQVVMERNFIVFKSGTQVLGEATPSASLITPTVTKSASVTASVKPSLSPKPTATSSTVPVSGNLSTTMMLVVSGLVFFMIGFAKFVLKV